MVRLPPFRIIAFDWDGTAVADRREKADAVRGLIEELLRLDVPVVVITGTNFQNVDRQLSAAITGPHKQQLYVATNRGSEVYGFDGSSRPVLLWRRQATPREERLLTEVADGARDTLVRRTGLEIQVIYERLNRRKIDLIPLPQWSDPPKSAIASLLEAVQRRLKGAGLEGGLAEAVRIAEHIARQKRLSAARVTSDVKHVEVGLTDKSDSIEWVMRELAQSRGVPPREVLIAGDEFGPVGGFPGSDDKMVAPSARGAFFLSVGREPEGVPPGILHLGGGPGRFRELLAEQIALHRALRPAATTPNPCDLPLLPTTDPSWLLVEKGFNLAREHEIESLFALSNGYVGTRGSLAEGSALSSPATFVAGLFERNPDAQGIPGLVPLPQALALRGAVDGQELSLASGETLLHRRVLDLKQGILWREWRHRDSAGRINLIGGMRLASLADRHLLLQSVTLTAENYSGQLAVEVRMEKPPHVELAGVSRQGDVAILEQRIPGEQTTVALAMAGQILTANGREVPHEIELQDARLLARWAIKAELGKEMRADRLVAIYDSRDSKDPVKTAAAKLREISPALVQQVAQAHVEAWAARWRASDVEVSGDMDAQLALRFACYHLIGAANPENDRVSIGARGLTGHAYKGHVFWDTEIFMLPFYALTQPEAARALLMYRYHTLPAARAKARRLGYRGALFPWESADDGEEVTPPFMLTPEGEVVRVLSGEQEHHISADVAYATWSYWQCSGDNAFFGDAGAELLLETARFWSSRGRLEEDGRFHIRKVIGPDEFHEGVDNNAYTNGMAQWNLERGAEAAQILAQRWPERWRELRARLEIDPAEPEEWSSRARAMYTGFDARNGLIEQFSGYFTLEELDPSASPRVGAALELLLGRERLQRSKVVKQADVLMLIYLLWDRFPAWVREANFRYYEPRTCHGSSLSPAIHALLAARLGDRELALRYFRQASEIDLADNMGNAAGGVHAAALGGLWQAAVHGFGGLRLPPEGPAFDPHLPEGWRALRFALRWRGRRLRVSIEGAPPRVDLREEAE